MEDRQAYNRSLQCWRDNCRVVNVWDDPTACKPRGECQPFTFELAAASPTWIKTQERVSKAIHRELARKKQPKSDNVAAFLKMKFRAA